MEYDIPFVPSSDDNVRIMVELAAGQSGGQAVDLGAGDGKVVVALAERGLKATGVEIDQSRFELAKHVIMSRRLESRANMVHESFWVHNLQPYDIIVLYGIPSIMERLKRKIINEASPPCWVISNNFEFPDWQPAKSEGNVLLYAPFS